MFSMISFVSFISVAAFLVTFSYTKQKKAKKESPDKKQAQNFSDWLVSGLRSFFKTSLKNRIKKINRKHLISELSITEKIIWGGLVFSFLYLFLSGFFFSLFSLRLSFGLSLAFFCCSLLPLSLFPLSPISDSPCPRRNTRPGLASSTTPANSIGCRAQRVNPPRHLLPTSTGSA